MFGPGFFLYYHLKQKKAGGIFRKMNTVFQYFYPYWDSVKSLVFVPLYTHILEERTNELDGGTQRLGALHDFYEGAHGGDLRRGVRRGFTKGLTEGIYEGVYHRVRRGTGTIKLLTLTCTGNY